jgi:hypothetical protein
MDVKPAEEGTKLVHFLMQIFNTDQTLSRLFPSKEERAR